jgi:hypothetical protein
MQMLKAETCVRQKTGNRCESGTDEGLTIRKEEPFWGLCPQAPGILPL